MQTIRTRIARLAAASAVAVSLGALAAGPAAAQSGSDIGSSRAASVAGTGIDWYYFTLPANPGDEPASPIDTLDNSDGTGNLYFQPAARDVTFGN